MEAVALFTYSAAQPDEVSFNKGEVVKVTDMEDESWFTAEVQGKRGYVPENYISLLPHPWFAGSITRMEAEQRLRWQDTGVFLVRESESAPGEFSLSVSYGERVEHFRVLEGGGQYCIWEESFCSLNRLLDFYRTHSISMEKPVLLKDPPAHIVPPCGQNSHTHCPSNPPNPYRSGSQESLCSSRPPSRLSHMERGSSPQPLKPLMENARVAHALCDYSPAHSACLHFQRGDVIQLLDCSSHLTWRGRCRGRVGIFPPQYVQPLYN
ncbi:GRB2-related adapter protein-like [Periophthalmus magnuspinnatus]|uniref:GRB2-related adapter protein-like n=1 Tax=Periophthalmus magnuspinnatus TaxID=409849 RepID=UPI00145B7230|nr:GRB2-related adapter protein-like [Periophthalmus magnuspinnatus]